MEDKIHAAVIYCAAIHDIEHDVRNDAANIFADNKAEYEEIWRVLDFKKGEGK